MTKTATAPVLCWIEAEGEAFDVLRRAADPALRGPAGDLVKEARGLIGPEVAARGPASAPRDKNRPGLDQLDDEALDRPTEIVSICCSKFPVDDFPQPHAPANQDRCCA